MNDMNYVVIEGKLAQDPQLTFFTAESVVCRFSIAVNRYLMDKETGTYVNKPNYFLIETWGKVAQNCGKYLSKGRGVRVAGRLKQVTWKDKNYEDLPRERIYIFTEHIEFAPQKAKLDDPEPKNITLEPENNNESDTTEVQQATDLNATEAEYHETENETAENK